MFKITVEFLILFQPSRLETKCALKNDDEFNVNKFCNVKFIKKSGIKEHKL